ncbi:Helix-turn-helix protein [Thiovulum sp. ES]|nr:Helix-turn-helix protein [Thiovulum sp. ES]
MEKENFDLKAEIKNLGMTQKEFAEYIDVHMTTVSRWVRNELEIPKLVKLVLENYKKAKLFDEVVFIKQSF